MRLKTLNTVAVLLLAAAAHGADASMLRDGVTPDTSGRPEPGELLLAIYDTTTSQTLLVNTHWRYTDLANGAGAPVVNLGSDPNFQAIQNDPLVYNVVGAYDLYLNPDTGKSNLDKASADPPFDDEVPNNAPWGVIATGHAADSFSAELGDLQATLVNGVQIYWTAANTALVGVGATDSGGPDSVLVEAGDSAEWDIAWGGDFGASGLGSPDPDASTVHGFEDVATLFWITNPSALAAETTANSVTALGTLQLSAQGRLSYTAAGGPPPTNHPPVASIAAPATVNSGTPVTLDGSGSSDPDADPLSYAWSQSGGPVTVALDGAATATARFTAGVVGDYQFTLTVTDSQNATATTAAQVSVTAPINHPPLVTISPATLAAHVGSTVVLDGSGSGDPDAGDTLTYRWTWVSGPDAPALTGADTATAGFTATQAGDYVFSLTVTDPQGAPASGSVRVSIAANQAPLARAGAEARVGRGATVVLDGSGSSDPDGDPLTYAWFPVSGPAASPIPDSGNGATARFVAASSGVYVFKLVVTDRQGATSDALVSVKAGPGVALNAPTTWLVGRAQTIGVTGFQLKGNARAKLRFSTDGQHFTAIGNVALKAGVFRWKPARRHITRQGIIQACQDIRKPSTCDQIGPLVVLAIPE